MFWRAASAGHHRSGIRRPATVRTFLASCEVAAQFERGNAPRGLASHCLLSKAERKGLLKLLKGSF